MPVQNQLGIGKAQVTPDSQFNGGQIVQLYQQRKDREENQRRYDSSKKEQDEKELYGILGDAFNPKNFNTLLHGRLKDEVSRLAQKIKTEGGNYGDVYLEANQKAGELSAISGKLNSAKSLIDESEKEWAGYEGIDPVKIKRIAESNLAKDLQSGKIEDNKFYFDEAMNQYGHRVGLTSGANTPNFKFQTWEKQTPSKSVVSTDARGGRKGGTWKGEYYPAFYTVDMGNPDDLTPPTVKINEEESGLSIKGYDKMLNKDAYDRYIANKTEVLKLNREIENRFGNINLQSEEAEKLRRAIARENVLKYLPVNPDIASNEKEAPQISIRNYSGGGTPKKDEGANWVKRATAAINEDNPVDIEDTFGELFKGNNAPYVGIKKNGDNFTVTYKDKQGYEATEDFNVKDRQLPNKLARLYQMIMGSDVKMEKGDYGTQDVPVMPKNDNPKGKGGWKPFSKKNTTITPTKDNPLGLDL